MPMLKNRSNPGPSESGVSPLFPCYQFAKFELHERLSDVRYQPGVAGLLSPGAAPVSVPAPVVEQIKRGGIDSIVDAEEGALKKDDYVCAVDGPFRGLQAIFECYVSSEERVSNLLSTVGVGEARVALPSMAVAAST